MNNEYVTKTLNNVLSRHSKVVHGYEVEIANLTAEIYRLQDELEQLKQGQDVHTTHDKME
jgi:uncharacterized small protein (DUF1192 family)